MRKLRETAIALLVAGALATGGFGCAAAAVGAGAAGAIAYTERGAKGNVKGDTQKVTDHAKEALKKKGIQVTGSEVKESGKEQQLTGKSGKTDITVNLSSAPPDMTSVEVIARESAIKWNKDYAKEILSDILNQA